MEPLCTPQYRPCCGACSLRGIVKVLTYFDNLIVIVKNILEYDNAQYQ